MFCPEGYVSLQETEYELYLLGRAWWKDTGRAIRAAEIKLERDECEQSGAVWTEDETNNMNAYLTLEAYRRWAMQYFTSSLRERLCVASPDGKVMRLGSFAFRPYNWSSRPFPEARKDQLALEVALQKGFYYLTADYFTVKADAAVADATYLDFEIKTLSAFEGWAACWKPKDFDKWRTEAGEILVQWSPVIEPPKILTDPDGKRGPGRQKLGGGAVETAIQREFSRRLAAGALPFDQREATLSEASEWAHYTFGFVIPRSTVQRYLAPVFKEMDAHK